MLISEEIHFKRLTEVELRLILGLVLIALINVLIYKNLSIGQPSFLTILNNIGTYIYAACIAVVAVGTIFKSRLWIKYGFTALLIAMTMNIFLNLIDLIINHRISDNGTVIVFDASLILFSSLGVFAFWYWLIDRGGPIMREIESHDYRYDLLFPQYQSKIPGWEKWKPNFWDYYVFSFFTSTGFSPADTLPLSITVKVLMMLEASISLIIIGMVISRAISLIS